MPVVHCSSARSSSAQITMAILSTLGVALEIVFTLTVFLPFAICRSVILGPHHASWSRKQSVAMRCLRRLLLCFLSPTLGGPLKVNPDSLAASWRSKWVRDGITPCYVRVDVPAGLEVALQRFEVFTTAPQIKAAPVDCFMLQPATDSVGLCSIVSHFSNDR